MQLVMQTVFGLQLVRMVELRTPKMVNSGSRSLLGFLPTSLDWTFGDDKFVAVGLDTSIYSSSFEFVSAAGTATVSAAGTVSAVTLTDGGFGYDDRGSSS